MAFEYTLAASYLPARGVILTDGIDANAAFSDVMRGLNATACVSALRENIGAAVLSSDVKS